MTKTCFLMHMTHYSVNFIWFALLSHQKFDDRLLFDLLSFWIASKQIFLWDKNNFCYILISNNAKFTFMEKFWFTFFQTFPLFIECFMYNCYKQIVILILLNFNEINLKCISIFWLILGLDWHSLSIWINTCLCAIFCTHANIKTA